MRTVHQVIAGAAPGDAVTDQALRLRALLRGWGFRSEIIAEHVHPGIAAEVHRLAGPGDPLLGQGPLVVRYSIWGSAVAAAMESGVPVAAIYHNITPPELLRAANPEVASLCEAGRAARSRLVRRASVLIADSAYNADDLRQAGADGDIAVVPLLFDAVDPPAALRAADGVPRVLTVGRLAPNKRVEDAVRAVGLLQRTRSPGATLTVVGSDSGFPSYGRALRAFAAGTRGVRFTGRIPDEDRDRAYGEATVYVCMSVHEGFCMPLVEALQAGVPVVARAAAAVPETLGEAGVVLPDEDPLVFSEALWEVSRSAPLRARLADAARARLADLDPAVVSVRLRDALAPILDAA